MILKIFTKGDGPEARDAKELGAGLEAESYQVEYLDVDDQANTNQVELYDVYSYPTFIATGDDGTQIEIWRGRVPLESDLKMFLNQ